MQCANNFKQVGLAMHNYHTAIGSFPPGLQYYSAAETSSPCLPVPAPDFCGWGWSSFILPYLEQQGLYNQFRFDGNTDTYVSYIYPGYSYNYNLVVAAQAVQAYLCPSDPQGGELVDWTHSTYPGHSANPLEDVMITNLAGVIDSRSVSCLGTWSTVANRQFAEADGIMANIQPCKIADIHDGTSNTLMVGEVTGGGPGTNDGMPWLMGNVMDSTYGINGQWTVPGGGPGAYCWYVTGFSSFHPDGCHFLFADGSVQFLSQNIRFGRANPANPAERASSPDHATGGEVVTGGY